LGDAAARDQAGALEHLEVAGDGGKAYLERLGQLVHGGLSACEAREDGSPRWVRQGGERAAQLVGGGHLYLTSSLSNLLVKLAVEARAVKPPPRRGARGPRRHVETGLLGGRWSLGSRLVVGAEHHPGAHLGQVHPLAAVGDERDTGAVHDVPGAVNGLAVEVQGRDRKSVV